MSPARQVQSSSFAADLAALQRRIEVLERTPRSGSTAVDSGAFTVRAGVFDVRGDDGNLLFAAGTVAQQSGETVRGVLARRVSGTDAWSVYADASGDLVVRTRDKNGTVIGGDDPAGGLARPWLPLVFQRPRTTDWAAVTAVAWETVWEAVFPKQQPRVAVSGGFSVDAGTTGEVRVRVGGVVTGDVVTAGTGTYDRSAVAPGDLYAAGGVHVEVQARRITGTGRMWVGPPSGYGRES